MTIDFLSPDKAFIHSYLAPLVSELEGQGHAVRLVGRHEDLAKGDVLFILSYLRIVPKSSLALHKNNIVVHASDLPQGKGWSPMPWQIVEGKNDIVFTLFEAAAEIDAGPYYEKRCLHLNGTELFDEWKALQSEMVVNMIRSFLASYPKTEAKKQEGQEHFYRRRTRDDDQLDVKQPLEILFDRIRVCDPDRYPAWFELRGRKYKLSIAPLQDSQS
jgi:methionyl-tRNA formyltransferase